jgi:hypothetical protein
MALSLLLALLAILPTRAQGPGPKGGPFIPGAPPPPTPPPSPAFRQAAEAALQAYLQAHGPATPMRRMALDGEGRSSCLEESPLSSIAPQDSWPSPWDVSWIPSDPNAQNRIIAEINAIVTDPSAGGSANSGLAGHGGTILYYSLNSIAGNPAGVNPAFALAMFRKEANFARPGTIAYNQNNPGNLRCCYGAIGVQNGFAVYATMDDGIKAYFWLLQYEYKPGGGSSHNYNCNDISCIISRYCPPSECDTSTYIQQVGTWTQEFQARLQSAASTSCPQSGGVILYQHANYDCGGQGESLGYVIRNSAGFQNVPSSFNDRASSIRIPSGWSVRLYEHTDAGGGKKCINAPGDSDFANDTFDNGVPLNDNASSFEVFTSPDCSGGVSPDTTPPSGDYTSPSNGATVGRTVHLAAWASDNQSGVREVHFTAKWSGQWHLVYNDTSAPYEYDWDLCASGVPDGDIELGLDIWDNAGNEFHLHTVHPNPHITKSYNCSPSSGTWSVDYWNNKYLAGYVNWHNNESGTYIFRDWGGGGPGDGIQSDEWSARFVRTVYFPGGDYRFHCHRDDGCRLYIDGQIRIDQWWDASFEGGDWGGYLSPGNHEVKVEYYENRGDARLEAWWQGPGFLPRDQDCDPNQWCAEYFGNRNLAGTPAIHRNEGESLWHDWGSAGPDPTFPTDAFSSRFTRNATFACGTYRFHLFTDDGVRFWVDNVLKLDQWRDQVASYDVDVALSSGSHALKVEHYENGGGAAIRVWWEKLADCQPAVAVDYASTHYVRPGASVDPTVRVRVTAGYLDGGRGDDLTFVSGSALGASATQPIYGTVNEGSIYTFDVANNSGFRMTAPSSEGTYESHWQVKAAGNFIGPQATIRVVVDGTPPTIAIQSPTAGAYLNSNTVTVRATPQDASGIDQVQFFVGYNSGSGWAWQNLGWDLDGSDGWSRVWNAAGVADQAGVAFYAYVWDRAGNGAGTAVWDVTLDRTPPTTAIRPLVATQDSTAFIAWWEGSDNVSGVDHYDLQKRQDGGAWEDWHQGVGSQYVGAWFIGEMGHRYDFRMRGVDRAGNVEAYPGSAEAETYINYCSGDAYESDNGPAQARQIAVGQSQAHNFCGVDDQDWVKFWAWAGKRYVVQTGNLGWTGDTVLTLYDADGTTVLAENDDIAYPDNLASRVEWIAGRDGWLYARVRHYNGRIAGNAVTYTLWLEEGYRAYLPLVLRKP